MTAIGSHVENVVKLLQKLSHTIFSSISITKDSYLVATKIRKSKSTLIVSRYLLKKQQRLCVLIKVFKYYINRL